MKITRSKAQKLLSTSEYRLYESSRRGAVDDHGAARLKKLIESTRKHLEKYRGRASSQVRDGRGKGAIAPVRTGTRKSPPTPAENTALKVELFADILSRFETALVKAEARLDPNKGRPRPKAKKAEKKAQKVAKKTAKKAPAKRAAKKAAAKRVSAKKAKPTKKALVRAAAKKEGVRAAAAKKAAPIAEQRAQKKNAAAKKKQLAHGAARGRKNQARRDAS